MFTTAARQPTVQEKQLGLTQGPCRLLVLQNCRILIKIPSRIFLDRSKRRTFNTDSTWPANSPPKSMRMRIKLTEMICTPNTKRRRSYTGRHQPLWARAQVRGPTAVDVGLLTFSVMGKGSKAFPIPFNHKANWKIKWNVIINTIISSKNTKTDTSSSQCSSNHPARCSCFLARLPRVHRQTFTFQE